MVGDVAVPGKPCILDHDVPWVRTLRELQHEHGRLAAVMSAMMAGPFGNEEPATLMEEWVVGVAAAEAWTLGAFPRSPICRIERPVTGAAIREELDVATDWMQERRPGWAKVAGAVRWLVWITGAVEVIDYGSLTPASERTN